MKNKMMIAVVLLVNGCTHTPPKTPVEQYWINRNKAEAESKQNAVSVEPVATPQPKPVMTEAEEAKSKAYDKAYNECEYEASKATVGKYDVNDPYKALEKRVAEQELVKQCLSVKGF